MGRIWTEENKYRCWLQVEAAASDVLADDGVIPHDAPKQSPPKRASLSSVSTQSKQK
jgi:adenylosuccinate lyase